MKKKIALLLSVIMLFGVLACGAAAAVEETPQAKIVLEIYAYDPDKNVVDFDTKRTVEDLIVGDVVAIVPVLTNLSSIAEHGVFHFSYAFDYDTTYMKQMLFAPDDMIDPNAAQNAIIKQGLTPPLDTSYDVVVSTFREPDPNVTTSPNSMLFQMVFNYIGDGTSLQILKDNTNHHVTLGAYPFEIIDQPTDTLDVDVKSDEHYTSGLKLNEPTKIESLNKA